MWIVSLALRRPYTFVVLALVIILLMPLAVVRTPVDIFPDINIPVISVIWFYGGFAPAEMAQRIVTNSERGMTVTVNNIEHIESQSVSGIGVIKVFFSAASQHSDGAGAGNCHRADHGALPASRHQPAAGDHLQRVHHTDCAAWHQQQDAA